MTRFIALGVSLLGATLAMATPIKAATLDEVVARLDALEQENDRLREEVESLKAAAPRTDTSAGAMTIHPVVYDADYTDISDPEDEGLSISFDTLWLTPSLGSTHFVIDAPVSGSMPTGTRIGNDLPGNFGYRLGVAYETASGQGAEAHYTRFSQGQTTTVTGDFLWATVGRPDLLSSFENYTGTASSTIDVSYHGADLFLTQPIDLGNAEVTVLYGADFASLDVNRSYRYVDGGTTGLVNEMSKFTGIGPKAGLGYEYELFSNSGSIPGTLQFKAEASGSLLVASKDSSASNTLNGTILLNVMDATTIGIIPVLHMSAGLDYELDVGEYQASLGIGYEYTSYLGATGGADYPDDVADGQAISKAGNYDMYGPYMSLNFKF